MRAKKTRPKGIAEVVAASIRIRRSKLGLSQEQLAERCGYHRTYVSAIERAERNITLNTLSAIAGALDAEPWELLVDHD